MRFGFRFRLSARVAFLKAVWRSAKDEVRRGLGLRASDPDSSFPVDKRPKKSHHVENLLLKDFEVVQVVVQNFQQKVLEGNIKPHSGGSFLITKVGFDMTTGTSSDFELHVLRVNVRARVPISDENFVTMCKLLPEDISKHVGALIAKNVIGQDVDPEEKDLLFPITPAVALLAWLCSDFRTTSFQLQVLGLDEWPSDFVLYNQKVSPLLVPLLHFVSHSATYVVKRLVPC